MPTIREEHQQPHRLLLRLPATARFFHSTRKRKRTANCHGHIRLWPRHLTGSPASPRHVIRSGRRGAAAVATRPCVKARAARVNHSDKENHGSSAVGDGLAQAQLCSRARAASASLRANPRNSTGIGSSVPRPPINAVGRRCRLAAIGGCRQRAGKGVAKGCAAPPVRRRRTACMAALPRLLVRICVTLSC